MHGADTPSPKSRQPIAPTPVLQLPLLSFSWPQPKPHPTSNLLSDLGSGVTWPYLNRTRYELNNKTILRSAFLSVTLCPVLPLDEKEEEGHSIVFGTFWLNQWQWPSWPWMSSEAPSFLIVILSTADSPGWWTGVKRREPADWMIRCSVEEKKSNAWQNEWIPYQRSLSHVRKPRSNPLFYLFLSPHFLTVPEIDKGLPSLKIFQPVKCSLNELGARS